MLLNDVNINNTTKLAKINKYLSENFKFTVDSNSSEEVLRNLRKKIIEQNQYLRAKTDISQKDAEYTKNLSIIEAIDLILVEKRKLTEDIGAEMSVFDTVVSSFYPIIAHWWPKGVSLDSCIDMAMREYRSSPYVLDDSEVESALRQKWEAEHPATNPDHINPNVGMQMPVVSPEMGAPHDAEVLSFGEIDEIKKGDLPPVEFHGEEDVPTVYKPTTGKAQFNIDTSDRGAGFNAAPAPVSFTGVKRKYTDVAPKGSLRARLGEEKEMNFVELFNGGASFSINASGDRGNVLAVFGDDIHQQTCRVRFRLTPAGVEIATIVDRSGSPVDFQIGQEDTASISAAIQELLA